MGEWTDRPTDRETDGWMNGWMDRQISPDFRVKWDVLWNAAGWSGGMAMARRVKQAQRKTRKGGTFLRISWIPFVVTTTALITPALTSSQMLQIAFGAASRSDGASALESSRVVVEDDMKRMRGRGGAVILAEVFSFRSGSMGLCEGFTPHAGPARRTAPPLSDVPDTAESAQTCGRHNQ